MADFLELEIVKYRENENGEIVGIEWENVCINVDNIPIIKRLIIHSDELQDIKRECDYYL